MAEKYSKTIVEMYNNGIHLVFITVHLSHVTGYPARSRDRSCDRHTATATRPSHPWPGRVPGHVPGHVMS